MEKGSDTIVKFHGGTTKKYSVVVMADGTLNSFLSEFKKRRPAEFRHELSSIIIPRNEYDPDSLIDLFVFGKRAIVTPISSTELQVTFHEMCEQVPTSPLTRQLPVNEIVDRYHLVRSAEDPGSMQSVLQRIVNMPGSKACFVSNPRFFNISIPRYNKGKILMYPCRRQSVDVAGVISSFQIEECAHLAKAIAIHNSPGDIAKAYEQATSKKEQLATNFCKKTIDTAIYQAYMMYLLKFCNTVLSHQMFGRINSKYNNATKPSS